MWLRFKFSLFLPPLYFSLSLSFSLYFSVSRVPPSSLFNALPFFSPLYFISLCLFPLFRSLFGFLPMHRYLLSLSSLQHFYHHTIFFPCLFIPFLYPFLFLSRIHTRIFLLPYFSSYSLLLPFTYSLSRAFSVPLAPTPSTLTHSAFFLVRLLTRSVSFTALSSLSDSRGWSGSLFARQPSPPLSIPYCHLVIVPRIYESSRVERC